MLSIVEPEHLLADFLLILADPHPVKWNMGAHIILSFISLFTQWISDISVSIHHIGQVFCQVLEISHRANKVICMMQLPVWVCSRRKRPIRSSYKYLYNYSTDGCQGMVPEIASHYALRVSVIFKDCQTCVHAYSTQVVFPPFCLFLPWDLSSLTRFFF